MTTRRQKHVLLIEDQEGFRQIFSDIIRHSGNNPIEAPDGEKGLTMAKNLTPDLILLDLFLPKVHGFKVLEELRKNPTTKKIPVIIISVLEEPESKRKGLELGASDYWVKSNFSSKEISEKIADILQK